MRKDFTEGSFTLMHARKTDTVKCVFHDNLDIHVHVILLISPIYISYGEPIKAPL